MRTFCLALALGLSLMSFSAFSTRYVRGSGWLNCSFFNENLEEFQKHPGVPETFGYATCLLARNAPGDTSQGLTMLRDLSQNHNYPAASYILAKYYQTNGAFGNEKSPHYLKETESYLIKTLDDIRNTPNYPPDVYQAGWEKWLHLEVQAHRWLARTYLDLYYNAAVGDYHERLMDSPSYIGEKNRNLYSEYRDRPATDYLELAIQKAQDCQNLPYKAHFDRETTPYWKQVCAMYEESARDLFEIHIQVEELYKAENCQDLVKEVLSYNCPKLRNLHKEASELYASIATRFREITRPIAYRLTN